MSQFLILFFVLISLLRGSDFSPIYEIRGASPLLDTNLSCFLQEWRTNTLTPIQNGNYCNVIINADPNQKKIALTFDDSPDENVTSEVLDVLKRYNIKAAFFMVANSMQEINATVVRRADHEGHLVLSHSFSHTRLTTLDNDHISKELDDSAHRIEELTGKYPILMRPPYGSINTEVVNTINQNGFTAILWSLDSLDWAIQNESAIAENVISNIRPGEIILMHSGRGNPSTPKALPKIIESLSSAGYYFERLDTLLSIKPHR